ncbi:Hypothetical predicted protein [Scomber scombrus]|uniref:Uncharacterized protein n=1 Tax=Scomber scombrus TaxID=13677 RepID=A0AAV1MVJ4_SCOSC
MRNCFLKGTEERTNRQVHRCVGWDPGMPVTHPRSCYQCSAESENVRGKRTAELNPKAPAGTASRTKLREKQRAWQTPLHHTMQALGMTDAGIVESLTTGQDTVPSRGEKGCPLDPHMV